MSEQMQEHSQWIYKATQCCSLELLMTLMCCDPLFKLRAKATVTPTHCTSRRFVSFITDSSELLARILHVCGYRSSDVIQPRQTCEWSTSFQQGRDFVPKQS